MKKLLFSIFALILPLAIFAEGWDDALYKQIEQNIKAPTFNEKIYKPAIKTTYSAAKNQKAINKAIEKASKNGGGKVVIPAGTYMTGAITLLSDVNLVIEKDAVLKFAFEPELYPLVYTRYEGLDVYNYSPCIYSNGAKNIGITGEGIIDGNGSNETFWQWTGVEFFGYKKGVTKESSKFPREGETMGARAQLQQMCEDNVPIKDRIFGMGRGLRMQLVNLVNSENIIIEGVTMLNSPFWVMHPMFSKNITVRGVKVYNEGPNGDGCDPESCENVLIENCVFDTGDDCIAIKSGRNGDGRRDGRPSKNIIIRNCKMADGHGGVVLGSEISGGVENVFAENCEMDSPNLDRVLRIKTNTCRGGETKNVFMRNVKVGECKEAVLRININYQPREAAERGHIPYVHNVWMENVTCQKSKHGVIINGIQEAEAVYDIHVNNCTFNGVEAEPFVKENRMRDVHFNNLTINGKPVFAEMPFKHYSEWLTWSEMQRVPNSIYLDFTDSNKHPKGKWSYVMGIELESMLDTYLKYGNEDILKYCKMYTDQMINEQGDITGYNILDYNLDNIRTGHFVTRMYELYPEAKNLLAIQTMMKQMEKQPRTKDGVYWHKAIYAYQVWLDGIFMGLPFRVLTTNMMEREGMMKAKQAKKIYDDATEQILKTYTRTLDPKTGLNRHAWDETNHTFWADKTTGLSQHCWGRAQGWYTMALVELLDALPADYARRGEIMDVLQKDFDAIIKWQDEKTGTWYQVMDSPERKGNYLESTCTSMFAYSMLKAYRKGYVKDVKYLNAGVKAYKGIINNFIRMDADKTISLTECCVVAGLGPAATPEVVKAMKKVNPKGKVKHNEKRDGSFEYYLSEPIRDNDAKGVGPFIWASLEMEMMGYDTSSKY